jgi:hypothetical protein
MTDGKKLKGNSTRNAIADTFEAMGEFGCKEMTDDKVAGEGPYRIGRPEDYEGTSEYCSARLIGPGLGRWGAPEISDLMATEKDLIWLVYVANAIYAAGRKAERDRCAKIANRHLEEGAGD